MAPHKVQAAEAVAVYQLAHTRAMRKRVRRSRAKRRRAKRAEARRRRTVKTVSDSESGKFVYKR